MEKYVAYYRVSTQKQGGDGYGVEAQRAAVRNFTGCKDGTCIEKEFIEVESGTNKRNHKRIALQEAIDYCTKHKCTLVISKLDRLSRSVAFLFNLRDAGVKFHCIDLPKLDTMSLGMFATFAQYEAERISVRTREALAARKSKGLTKKVVNNLTPERIRAGHEAIKNKAKTATTVVQVSYTIKGMRKEGKTYREIAIELRNMGFKTSKGERCNWTPIQVQRIDKRF